jgi:two-component system nitrogen regulation response regulator GlnG
MKSAEEIWVVDDDRSIRWVLEKSFRHSGFEVTCFESAEKVLKALDRRTPDVVVTDIRMPGMDGLALLEKIRGKHVDLPVIVITAHSDLDSAISSYEGGAFEYLPKPFDIDEAVSLVKRACEQSRQQRSFGEAGLGAEQYPEIIGEAPAMQEVFRAIGRLSRSNINVLINGQSGTGKELVARALHRHSPRAKKPFIALNMAAIPKDLLESELFGHERGAFTGAHISRKGRFEQADGGTLFLDEIGDMPSELQTRLLRVLEDGEFYPVGAHTPIKVDVRIIAATHQNLERLVAAERFREDLFHRLNVIRIHIPALRERRQDIPALSRYFLKKAAGELNVDIKKLSKEAENFLSELDWPGNVRQLENCCRWLTVMASGQEIFPGDLPPELIESRKSGELNENWEHALKIWTDQQLAAGKAELLDLLIPKIESVVIRSAMERSGGRRQDAAKLLGWGRNTLARKIKELGLDL